MAAAVLNAELLTSRGRQVHVEDQRGAKTGIEWQVLRICVAQSLASENLCGRGCTYELADEVGETRSDATPLLSIAQETQRRSEAGVVC